MAIYQVSDAGRARADTHRLRLTRHQVYACRGCRECVRVTSTRYLPDRCPGCGESTWDDDMRCAARNDCVAVRRPGVRGRAHCHACGHSVWTLVSAGRRASVIP
jgi:hypothetical protein